MPCNCPIFSLVPTILNPQFSCSWILGLFVEKIPDFYFQNLHNKILRLTSQGAFNKKHFISTNAQNDIKD